MSTEEALAALDTIDGPGGSVAVAPTPARGSSPDDPADLTGSPGPDVAPSGPRRPVTGLRGWAALIGGWVVIAAIGSAVVLYALSPVFQQRDQHRLLTAYKVAVKEASLEGTGFFGVTLPTVPPATGSTVGVLEIARLHLQEAVTEGAGPAQTEQGPGHVPGTAGLGQPGNSAIVGRRAAFGGSFAKLSELRPGDTIVVTTTEGQSLYVVTRERSVTLASTSATQPAGPGAAAASAPGSPATLGPTIPVADLYGTSAGNRLTLVTSASLDPWNRSKATVVVATMETKPFTATPQQSLNPADEGRSGAGGAWAPLVLALQAFGLVAWGAVFLYRRTSVRTAYLVTTAPLVVVTVVLALAVGHVLPAWV